MKMTPLSAAERNILVNALYVARDQYRTDAKHIRENDQGALSFAEQFERQATEAQALVEKLEEAEEIGTSDGE